MGDDLTRRLRADIRANGPMRFDAFMEAALYDPAEGYFVRDAGGRRGDFATGPHLSPLFGALVARQVEDFWLLLDAPDPFSVIEVGAGDGALCGQVMDALLPPLRDAVRYIAVDRSPAARAALGRLTGDRPGVSVAERLDDVSPADAGCLLANELLDNLPFHWIRGSEHGPVELAVDARGDGFVLVEAGPPEPEVGRLVPEGLALGAERAVGVEAIRFLDRAAAVVRHGYVWLIDYAAGGDAPTPVHGYVEGAWTDRVLDDPGSRDITAGVDLDALAAHARERGWHVWGPVSQRDALLALGFRELDERAQARQVEAVRERRGIEALRIYSNRGRANLLLGRGAMGAFRVLCVGVNADGLPRSMLGPEEGA
jgi:SAM-dependent MidA family methyltransferase